MAKPPFIGYPGRRLALFSFLFAFLAAMSVWVAIQGRRHPELGNEKVQVFIRRGRFATTTLGTAAAITQWVGIPFFAFLAAAGLLQVFLRRPYLIIEDEGIRLWPGGIFRASALVPWDEIKSFHIYYRFIQYGDHKGRWSGAFYGAAIQERFKRLGIIPKRTEDVPGGIDRIRSLRHLGLTPFDIPCGMLGLSIEDALDKVAEYCPRKDIPITGLKPARPVAFAVSQP